jgi:RNA polymerase sigma-70 factor, ECF subfamily
MGEGNVRRTPPGPRESPSDAELVGQVLDGDRECYAALVERHQKGLFGQARAMGLDPDTSADMVQDALISAYRSLADCRDGRSFGTWVRRILRNRCLDYLKSAATRRNVGLVASLPEPRLHPERDHERTLLRRGIEEALEALPAEQREAFFLRHADGLSYQQMVEVTGASVSAMKMRVHRAVEALRQHLEARGVVGDTPLADVTAEGDFSS